MTLRGRQLSVFGVEARPPSPIDLEGLLAGLGQVSRMGGTARVSIEVDADWRVAVLRGECALRGLATGYELMRPVLLVPPVDNPDLTVDNEDPAVDNGPTAVDDDPQPVDEPVDNEPTDDDSAASAPFGRGEPVDNFAADSDETESVRPVGTRSGASAVHSPTVDNSPATGSTDPAVDDEPVDNPVVIPPPPDRYLVRTAYSTALSPLGARWLRGTGKNAPKGFVLDGLRLRLWVEAAGAMDGTQAFVLRTGPVADPDRDPVGRALAAAGLPAALSGMRAGAPAYRIVGRRRITRLAELIGEPPRQVPPGFWPV